RSDWSCGRICSLPSLFSPSSAYHMVRTKAVNDQEGLSARRVPRDGRTRHRGRRWCAAKGVTCGRGKLTAWGAWGIPRPRMRARMMHTSVALIALLLVAAGGCGKSEPGGTAAPAAGGAASSSSAPGEAVATYKGHTLTSGQVTQELERLPAPSRAYLAAPDRKRQFVENLVMNDLLFQEGQKQGFDRDAEIERQVADLRKRLVVQRVMKQYQSPPTISDDTVKAQYDQNPAL